MTESNVPATYPSNHSQALATKHSLHIQALHNHSNPDQCNSYLPKTSQRRKKEEIFLYSGDAPRTRRADTKNQWRGTVEDEHSKKMNMWPLQYVDSF